MQLEVSGRIDEVGRYRSVIDACLKHYDDVRLGSRWAHPLAKNTGYFLRDALASALAPSDDWSFTLTFEDDDFGMWFKLKYL